MQVVMVGLEQIQHQLLLRAPEKCRFDSLGQLQVPVKVPLVGSGLFASSSQMLVVCIFTDRFQQAIALSAPFDCHGPQPPDAGAVR